MASIAGGIEIYGGIWGREPISKVLSNLVPCEDDWIIVSVNIAILRDD
jgi:hypothetical protein